MKFKISPFNPYLPLHFFIGNGQIFKSKIFPSVIIPAATLMSNPKM
jgi:hypothetical protein